MQALTLAQTSARAPGAARRASQASAARLPAIQQPQRLRRSLVARAEGQGSSEEGTQQVRGGGRWQQAAANHSAPNPPCKACVDCMACWLHVQPAGLVSCKVA